MPPPWSTQIAQAIKIIREIAAEVDPRTEVEMPGTCRLTLEVLPSMVGVILGAKGSTAKMMKQKTGASLRIEGGCVRGQFGALRLRQLGPGCALRVGQ